MTGSEPRRCSPTRYGIVNGDMPQPQMFLFDFARIKFELDHRADGDVEVRFLVPPSERGIGLLEGQLKRLADFAAERRSQGRVDRGAISEYEWDMIWSTTQCFKAPFRSR